jgi:hypothetical protein
MKNRLGFLAALCGAVLLALPEGYAQAAATFTKPLMTSGRRAYLVSEGIDSTRYRSVLVLR